MINSGIPILIRNAGTWKAANVGMRIQKDFLNLIAGINWKVTENEVLMLCELYIYL